MNSMNNWKEKVKSFFVWAALSGITLVGCDMLQKDAVQDQDQVKISNNEIYITSNSSGIIDLKGMVQSYSSIKLSVSGQPKFGKLDPFDKDLLKYTPNAGFKSGRDGFAISIYSKTNDFIKSDSVRIIVKNDSTGLPCGLWAMNDIVNNVKDPVEIDVLNNDILCQTDRSKIQVSFLQGSNDSLHQSTTYGTIEVLASKKIRYTPKSNFSGHDQFAYRITKPANVPNQGDAVRMSYGFVYINGVSNCKDSLKVENDQFNFTLSQINPSDSIRISPTSNDVICRNSSNTFQITITQQPQGKIFYNSFPPYQFKYLLPPGAVAGFNDTFKYRICVDDVCKEGEVKLGFN